MSTINTGTSSPGTPLDAAGLRAFRTALGFSTPAVFHVEEDGDDTTGDGSISAPWASFGKALNEAQIYSAYNGITGLPVVIKFGVSVDSFGDYTAGLVSPYIRLVGSGYGLSKIGSLTSDTAEPLRLWCENLTSVGTINTFAYPGADEIPGESPGTDGGAASSIIIEGLEFNSITSFGGAAGGGSGTVPGLGGAITLIGCRALSGAIVESGPSGYRGSVVLLDCDLREGLATTVSSVSVGKSMMPSGFSLTTDLGGNAFV